MLGLVLSRMRDERIIIRCGDTNIIVTVADIRGDKVRLGVHAPPHVLIDREEVAREKAGAGR